MGARNDRVGSPAPWSNCGSLIAVLYQTRPWLAATGGTGSFSSTKLKAWLVLKFRLPVSGEISERALLRIELNSPFKSEALRAWPEDQVLTRARAISSNPWRFARRARMEPRTR